MSGREGFERILERFAAEWSRKDETAAIVVYGSFLTGKMGRYSDLDVLVVKREDYPLESCVYIVEDRLLNLSVMRKGEFVRRLNAGCLSPLRLQLARYEVVFDRDGEVTEALRKASPCTRFEMDKYALTLLYRFLLQLGRAENYFNLGETLDAMHYIFHAFEQAVMLALLEKGLPFDRDVFNAGLQVVPDTVTAVQDLLGSQGYDLALVSELLEKLREEREDLLARHRDRLLSYMPERPAALSELRRLEVFAETDYILFQSYVEAGVLKRVGVEREIPGFPGSLLDEVAFVRA